MDLGPVTTTLQCTMRTAVDSEKIVSYILNNVENYDFDDCDIATIIVNDKSCKYDYCLKGQAANDSLLCAEKVIADVFCCRVCVDYGGPTDVLQEILEILLANITYDGPYVDPDSNEMYDTTLLGILENGVRVPHIIELDANPNISCLFEQKEWKDIIESILRTFGVGEYSPAKSDDDWIVQFVRTHCSSHVVQVK